MVLVDKIFDTTCWTDLLSALNGLGTLPNCEQIVVLGTGSVTFQFSTALDASQDVILDNFLSSWVCPAPDTSINIGSGVTVNNDGTVSDTILWSSQKILDEINKSGGESYYDEDIGDVYTTSKNYVERCRFTFNNITDGNYLISWSFSVLIQTSGKSGNYIIRKEGGNNPDITIHDTDFMSKGDKNYYSSDFTDVSGFKKATLGGNFDIIFEYRSKNSGNNICIRDVKINLRRFS